MVNIALGRAQLECARKVSNIALLLSSSAIWLAASVVQAQDMMEIDEPSVSILAFTGADATVVDTFTLTDFSSPLIADSGSILFGSNQRYFVSSDSGLEVLSDLNANPLFIPNTANPGIPVTMTLDQQTGDAFLGNGAAGVYFEGNIEATLFDGMISIGSQLVPREIRAQDGQILVVDDNDILFRGANAGDELGILLVATPSLGVQSGVPNDPKFGGADTVVASFSLNTSDISLEQAYSVRPLEGSSGLSRGPIFNITGEQVFAGITIPEGQFNTSSSLDQISSNGSVVAFTLPVAETAAGNFGVALVTQNITRDAQGNVTGVTDGASVVFDIFSQIVDDVPLSITATSIGDRVFLAGGTQFEAEINPTVSANGDVIFFGRSSVPGGDDVVSGFWRLRADNGIVEPFLTDGMQIDGITSFGTESFGILDFDSDIRFGVRLAIEPRLTINRDGNVAAIVRVLLPGEAEPVTAIVGQNVSGDFFLVAHEGQQVDLGGDAGVRTVAIAESVFANERNVTFVSGGANGGEVINSNDLDGISDGFNINSELAFVLSFTDGSQALLRAELGAAGPPEISIFRWVGGCGTAEWGTSCASGGETQSNWENFDISGQVAEQAPGLTTDPAQVFILGADVNITENDVSITSLSATDGTLTVDRSLVLGQASNVDELVVSGTVTSGSGPLTANKLTLGGGTLAGAGGFQLTDSGNTLGPLVTINPSGGGGSSMLNSRLQVTGGDVVLKQGSSLILSSDASFELREGGISGVTSLVLEDGTTVTGGLLTFIGDASIETDFNAATHQATINSNISLQSGNIEVSTGSLTLNGNVSIDGAAVLARPIEIRGGGRLLFNGGFSAPGQPDSGLLLTFDVQPDIGNTVSQLVFNGSTLTLNERSSLTFDNGANTQTPGLVATRAQAQAIVPTVLMQNTSVLARETNFKVSATLTNATFGSSLSASGVTLALSGTNQFTSRTSQQPQFDQGTIESTYILQQDGTTTIDGPGGTNFDGGLSNSTIIDVLAGRFNVQGARTQFGSSSEPFASSPVAVSLRPSASTSIAFGGNSDESRMTIGLGSGDILELGESGNTGTGSVRFDTVRFADITQLRPDASSAQIVNNLRGADGPNQGLVITDAVVDADFAIENNGNLLLDGLSGERTLAIENISQLAISSDLVDGFDITNTQVGRIVIGPDVTSIAGGRIENNGTLEFSTGSELDVSARFARSEDGVYDVGARAVVTATNQELTPIIRTTEAGADQVALIGNWDLDTDANVTLGEDQFITEIAHSASLELGAGASLNNLSSRIDTELEVIAGGFDVSGAFGVVGGLTVGGAGDGASLVSSNDVFVGENLIVSSGIVTIENDLRVGGDLEVTGSVSATDVRANSITIKEGGSIEFTEVLDTMDLVVGGTLTRVGNTLVRSVVTQAVTVETTGQIVLPMPVFLRVDGDFTNRGVFEGRLGFRSADDFISGGGSMTTMGLNLETEGDVTIGGQFKFADSLDSSFRTVEANNIEARPGATFTQTLDFLANEDLTIGENVTFAQPIFASAQTGVIASRVPISGWDASPSSSNVNNNTLQVSNGGVLAGAPQAREALIILGFDTGLTQEKSVDVVVRTTTIEIGGATEGNLNFSGDLINRGSIFPGFSPGLVQINGDYTQEAGGQVTLEIGGTTPDLHDTLAIGGTATFDPASTINITLIDPDLEDGIDEVFRPRTGDTFNILLADDVQVTGGANIADLITLTNAGQSGTFIPSFMTVDGQFMLQLEAMFGSRLGETAGLNLGQSTIAGALDSISEVGENEALTDFATSLDGLGDGQTGSALSAAGFSFASGLYDIGFAAISASRGHINRHIDARIWTPAGKAPDTASLAPPARPQVPNSAGFAGGMVFEEASQAAEMVASIAANSSFAQFNGVDTAGSNSRFGLIASGGYSFGSVDASLNQTGIDYSGGGGALGAEAALSDDVVVGISASLTSLRGDTGNALGEIDATHYGIAAHGIAEAGAVVIDGQIGVGWLDVESDRRIAVGGVAAAAQGDMDGSTFSARARISVPIKSAAERTNFVFGPSVELSATKVTLDPFAETGAGDIGLRLAGNTQWRSNFSFGLNAAASVDLGGVAVTPRASVAYEVSLNRDSDAIATTFVGASLNEFATPTDRIGKDRVKVLSAADLRLSRRMSASIAYQGSYGGDFRDHAVMAQARLSF